MSRWHKLTPQIHPETEPQTQILHRMIYYFPSQGNDIHQTKATPWIFVPLILSTCMINSLRQLLWSLQLWWSLAHLATTGEAAGVRFMAGKHCLSHLLDITVVLHCVILATRWGINSGVPWLNCLLQVIQWDISFQCSYNLHMKS